VALDGRDVEAFDGDRLHEFSNFLFTYGDGSQGENIATGILLIGNGNTVDEGRLNDKFLEFTTVSLVSVLTVTSVTTFTFVTLTEETAFGGESDFTKATFTFYDTHALMDLALLRTKS
jgi:hypothetical protein